MSTGGILNIALCLIVREGRILLIRRAKEPYRGWLGLPGGKLHFGETPAEAGLREAYEETGLSFAAARVAGCATELIRSPEGTALAQFTMFAVLLEGATGEALAGAEGELEWLPLSPVLQQPPQAFNAVHEGKRSAEAARVMGADIIPTDRILIQRALADESDLRGCPHFEVEENAGNYRILRIIG